MAKSAKTAPEKVNLEAEVRTEVGKKTKNLRKNGIIPANIFGQDYASKAIKMTNKNFIAAYKVARETGIIYINVDKESVPTLITHVQKHPVMNTVLHVDFRKVNLKQKLETTVPIEIVGESVALNQLNGVLLTQADHLMVEALPSDIPSSITIDISTLAEIGQDIKVGDLPKSDAYVIKEEPEKVIVSVTAHKEESVTPETTSEAPEITTAAEGEAGAEGEAPAEGGAEQKEEKSE